MQNIHDIIEIKRGLHRICNKDLVNSIAEQSKIEEFYRDIFLIYDLPYDTETIRQKRGFVAEMTKYFILDRLPEGCLYLNEDKYEIKNKKEIKKLLESALDTFYALRNTCNSNDEFKKKFAKQFNEEVRDFSQEISENRDDSLSDFAKTIQNVYYSKDEN